jgi:hypothetical protein
MTLEADRVVEGAHKPNVSVAEPFYGRPAAIVPI